MGLVCTSSVVVVVVLLVLLGDWSAYAEWVEIPQFSDRDKVYKPAIQFPQPQQQQQQHADRRFFVAQDVEPNYYKVSFYKDINLRNVSAFSDTRLPNFSEEPSLDATIASFTTERTVSTVAGEKIDDDANEGVKVQSADDEETMAQFDKPQTADDSDDHPDSMEKFTTTTDSSTRYVNETNDKGFLDYLPVDLLKRVHKTLKSQPATLKGKIRFLKVFEKTLLHEIESRLSQALAPTRSPRGAREHDWHDEGIGFPSLEGTLMAVSFLTFAVYLVRLVMMLFRSANNNTNAPIFVGRKKRSIDDDSEERIRILSYLETFPSHQY